MADITPPKDLFEALSKLTNDLEDNEDSNEAEKDEEFERLLNEFIHSEEGEDTEEEKDTEAEKKNEDDDTSQDGYQLCCSIDNNPNVYPVQGCIDEIKPDWGLYLHVDLVIPDINEQNTLIIKGTSLRCNGELNVRFDPETIALHRDGNRLHLKPTLLTDLFGFGYELGEDETDFLYIMVDRNDGLLICHTISVIGPWPTSPKPEGYKIDFGLYKDMWDCLGEIHGKMGWEQFKSRMDEMVARWQVGIMRDNVGLAINKPILHTIIMGNSGTGKSKSVCPFFYLCSGFFTAYVEDSSLF